LKRRKPAENSDSLDYSHRAAVDPTLDLGRLLFRDTDSARCLVFGREVREFPLVPLERLQKIRKLNNCEAVLVAGVRLKWHGRLPFAARRGRGGLAGRCPWFAGRPLVLTPQEKANLVAFLEALTSRGLPFFGFPSALRGL
jgi:hypothetical protein